MAMDKETLSKLLSMSDGDFKAKVKQAASASGISDPRFDMLMNDAGAIKKMLATMSEADIKRTAAALGTDKLEMMMKNLKDSMNK